MKKIYMPSDEILLEMQSLGGNVYNYLLVKAIEALIVDGVNYSNKGILKNAYKYLRENSIIARGVCLLYPNELKYSNTARYDALLAEKLITKSTSKEIYNLDNLPSFEKIVNENLNVILGAIDVLDKYLPTTPEYRFEYRSKIGKTGLLDDIFSTKILNQNMIIWSDMQLQMSRIEPAYALLIPSTTYSNENRRREVLQDSIRSYASRYGIYGSESRQIDLHNPDDETKRLIKCIKHDRDNLY